MRNPDRSAADLRHLKPGVVGDVEDVPDVRDLAGDGQSTPAYQLDIGRQPEIHAEVVAELPAIIEVYFESGQAGNLYGE